jgi:hypothetical protein
MWIVRVALDRPYTFIVLVLRLARPPFATIEDRLILLP